jgi:hypothetical protein
LIRRLRERRDRVSSAQQRSADRRPPAHAGGKRCEAVTSRVDIAPTRMALTGASIAKKAAVVKGPAGRAFLGAARGAGKGFACGGSRRRALDVGLASP